MRSIRYLLQAAIGLFALAVLVATWMSPAPLWRQALGAAAVLGFLFVLTLQLRERTETRLQPTRRRDPRVMALLLLFVGVGCVGIALSIVNGYGGAAASGDPLHAAIRAWGPWPVALFYLTAACAIVQFAYRSLRRG